MILFYRLLPLRSLRRMRYTYTHILHTRHQTPYRNSGDEQDSESGRGSGGVITTKAFVFSWMDGWMDGYF